ncbi:hypothetical protein ES703_90500 [subsurface metagenome]
MCCSTHFWFRLMEKPLSKISRNKIFSGFAQLVPRANLRYLMFPILDQGDDFVLLSAVELED